MYSQDRNNPAAAGHSRTIRDGGIAAAIAVSLELSMQTRIPGRITPAPPIDTPWVYSSRDWMTNLRSGWQVHNDWGILAGWNSGSGKWRPKE